MELESLFVLMAGTMKESSNTTYAMDMASSHPRTALPMMASGIEAALMVKGSTHRWTEQCIGGSGFGMRSLAMERRPGQMELSMRASFCAAKSMERASMCHPSQLALLVILQRTKCMEKVSVTLRMADDMKDNGSKGRCMVKAKCAGRTTVAMLVAIIVI
jgi:hypothetical protein